MTPERERDRVAYVAWREKEFEGCRFADYTDRKLFAAFRAGIRFGVELREYLAKQSENEA